MKIFPGRFLAVAMLGVCLIGCDDDDDDDTVISDGVSTGQIYATFQVISDGGEDVFVEAQLTRGVPPQLSTEDETFVRLVDDDELWFSDGADFDSVDFSGDLFGEVADLSDSFVRLDPTLREREVYTFLYSRLIINEFASRYSATLPQSDSNEYRVLFLRDEGRSARNSVVQIPGTFSVISPLSGERFSRSQDDIIIEWTNTDPLSSVEVEANTTCSDGGFDSYSSIMEDDMGMTVISAGELDSPLLEGICSTTLNVRKIRIGQFDPSFIGGAVNGYQIRRIVFTTES